MRCFYFGCWGDSGHYLWDEHANHARRGTGLPPSLGVARLDGEFAPKGPQTEGRAALHHVDGWTVLAFWDRSVDRRHGSHSTFVAEGAHDFAAMVAIARARFPRVWGRYRFEVRPRAGGDDRE